MRASLAELVAAASFWFGWFLLICSCLFATQRPIKRVRSASFLLCAALLFSVACSTVPTSGIPLVMPVISGWGWGVLMLMCGVIWHLHQILLASSPAQKIRSALWLAVLSILGLIFGACFFAAGGDARLVIGKIGVSWEGTGLLIALSGLVVLITGRIAKNCSRKAKIKRISTYLMLVIGTLIFTTPFYWLVVTSLKDQRAIVGSVTPTIWPSINELTLKNYSNSLRFLPPETQHGFLFFRNTILIVLLSVAGSLISCTLVAYSFARLRFPGRRTLFILMLSTMMLPSAVTLLPTFLLFKKLDLIDTLVPLWGPAFFGSAFNIFLLRQFLSMVPKELEDAAKIDGASHIQTLGYVIVPQVKPALATVALWTSVGAYNNFIGPLIYISSPEKMPISYALQLYSAAQRTEPALLMAFTTMAALPVVLLVVFMQRFVTDGPTRPS